MANVGTLVEPTTQAQYFNGTAKLPAQLFSHADQQVEWQTGWPDGPRTSGWGGRTADPLTSYNNAEAISMSVSLAGTNMFQVGQNIFEYQVSPDGAVDLSGFTQQRRPNPLPGGATDAQPAAPKLVRSRVCQNHQSRHRQQRDPDQRIIGHHDQHAFSGQLGSERSTQDDCANHRRAALERSECGARSSSVP